MSPDVVVVGGGPAGSTLARLLAGRGWDVVLLDRERFPRPKPCGECINPGGVRALRRLGLARKVEALDPVRLEGWDVETGGGARATGRFGDAVGPGWAVARSRLDETLLRAAGERGVSVLEGVRVMRVEEGTPTSEPSVTAVGRGGATRRWSARVVVGADGLRSVTARCLGDPAGPDRTRKLSLTSHLRGDGPAADRGRLVLTAEGTVGLAPLGRGLWNATVVVPARERGREVAADARGFVLSFLERHVRDWRETPLMVDGPRGSGNFDFRVRRVAGRGVLLVGDAAGYYDPLTGQGIYRALRSAELAAPVIDRALRQGRVSERALAAYPRRLRAEFGPGRRVQKVIEAVVSSGGAREHAVGRLAGAPGSMDALIRVTGDARPVRSLFHPSAWAPLLFLPGRGRGEREEVDVEGAETGPGSRKRPGGACEP